MGKMVSALQHLRGRKREADGKALQDQRLRDEGRRLQAQGRGQR
ncbi:MULTISPECIES: hypothetical protein [Streptomyces]|jgi:hypothetical protein|uniref:CsbD family protein n=1 Tax=Streptomyces silvae TaxID=2803812 RepID=A0ABU7ZXC6_9ACTN|nr:MULTISPECIES: hypothetical protein [unclassified Streptomyces]WSS60319.1 hypothetical protein OG284_03305 [Streptomyces sp. NBC_01177]WSS67427.1 hypothetical protein OG491_03520 [Streptomyces sp. NBC_01175]WSS74342.1 hypothetical protein OG414_03310 [Streptomyces sp. NBC_01174]MDX3327139.1 hypothetical protein [Streptomyces sp. ME02-6979-3A]MDX3428666.1 hypothetical protein [Streptomyces sp. ME01-18a]